MARFFTQRVGEVVQVFWAALPGGEFITDAAAAAGTYRRQGTRWVIANGGVRPRGAAAPRGGTWALPSGRRSPWPGPAGVRPGDCPSSRTEPVDDLPRAAA